MTRTLPIPSLRPAAVRRTRVLPAVLAALLPVLAACGGKDDAASSTSPAPSAGPSTPAAPASADATPTPQATTQEAIGDFQKDTDLVLEVDGKPAPEARIYNHETPPYFLVVSAALPAPVLINPRASSVETLDPAKVVQTPDGKANLLEKAVAKEQGTFTAGEDVRFAVDGKKGVLKDRPPLLGTQKVANLEAYSPLYDKGAAAYKPDAAVIAELRKQSQLVLLKVYFGSWCPHCKQEVPKLVRIEKELSGSSIHVEYYGLPRGFGQDAEAQRVKVDAVPTAIVYVGGREVGRLSANSWASPETALRDILDRLPPAG